MAGAEAVPAWPIRAGMIGSLFLERSLTDTRVAAFALRDLPYGRTRDRANDRLVLIEGRGTCSTKHALFARLAQEQGHPVALMLGIFQMDDRNTPGVGAVLERAGLTSIPEAHCYLRIHGRRIDITRDAVPAEPLVIDEERTIDPDQIGDYKVAFHRRVIDAWAARQGWRGDDAWQVRETCIAALADWNLSQPRAV